MDLYNFISNRLTREIFVEKGTKRKAFSIVQENLYLICLKLCLASAECYNFLCLFWKTREKFALRLQLFDSNFIGILKVRRLSMTRNCCNQNQSLALEIIMGNNQNYK